MSAKRGIESESHDNGVAATVILHFDYIYRCSNRQINDDCNSGLIGYYGKYHRVRNELINKL